MENEGISIETVIEQVAEAPYRALKTGRKLFAQKNRTAKRVKCEEIALATEAARALVGSEKQLTALLNDPLWEGHRPKHKPNDLPLLAVRFLLQSSVAKGTLYEQCRNEGLAVAHYVPTDMPFTAIVDDLFNVGGMYPLLDRLKQGPENDRGRSSPKRKSVPGFKGKLNSTTTGSEVKRSDVVLPSVSEGEGDYLPQGADLSSAEKRLRFDPVSDVVFECGDKRDRVLRNQHRTKLHLTATVFTDDPDWTRVVIDTVRAEHPVTVN